MAILCQNGKLEIQSFHLSRIIVDPVSSMDPHMRNTNKSLRCFCCCCLHICLFWSVN